MNLPDGAVRRAAVLGSPIAHSLSPALHRAAYAELGLAWRYDAIEVDAAGLPEFLVGLDPTWVGLSLTMPLKRTVIPLLDSVSGLAADVRAVNTVLFRDGVSRGENTDVLGLVRALQHAGVDRLSTAAILGGGATACSALAALRTFGVTEPLVHARRAPVELLAVAERLGVRPQVRPWPQPGDRLDADLVISTVPAQAGEGVAGSGLLFDVIYDPWPTPMALAWAGPVLGGLELLVEQALRQVELMTGRTPSLAVLRAAGEAALAAR